jgi:UbiD family decarboxylase
MSEVHSSEGSAVPTGLSDLRALLHLLRQRGELVEVVAPVDARLEVAEIHRRVIAAGGPALLFRRVIGSHLPVVTNLFGTARRIDMAFGRWPLRVIQDAVRLVGDLTPPRVDALWSARGLGRRLLATRPQRVNARSAPVLAVTEREAPLRGLPALTSWPVDGGPFLTLPLVYTEPPGGGPSNLGIYRMQIFDARTTGMHWQIGKGGGFHYAAAEGRGEDLPVSVFLGGPPALTLAAVAPLPENVPEVLLASLVSGRRLRTSRAPAGRTLFADAEIAIVGKALCGKRRPEGPFGDHYGYYSLTHDYPVFVADALHRRGDAIFPATVVGKPRQEDFFLGDFLQELLSPLFPLVMPGVQALWAYGETGYHALAAARVQERFRHEAMTRAFRILGEGQLALTKFLLVTDRIVDLRDFRATLTHVLERTHAETDLHVFADLSMDTLDYSGPAINEGSKGVWLGLGEPWRSLPHELRPSTPLPSDVRRVTVFSPGCLVIEGPAFASDPAAAERLASHPAFAGWPLLVLTDDCARTAASAVNFLWTTFTRFEPAADIHAGSTEVLRNHVIRHEPILIDARIKPWFPAELVADDDTRGRVSRRWREYFPHDDIAMGDGDAASVVSPKSG